MKKNIYIVWLEGWKTDVTPSIVWECARSWIARNPDWDVHLISDQNLKNFVDEEYIKETKNVQPIEARLDLLKYKILYENPGLFVGASTFCLKPLDSWLNNSMIVDDSFWLTISQEYFNMNMRVSSDVTFFDSDLIPSTEFLYSDKLHNAVYDVSRFDRNVYWQEGSLFYNYFRFWDAFIQYTNSDQKKRIANKWPYQWRKNRITDFTLQAGLPEYKGKLPTGVFKMWTPPLLDTPVDVNFLSDLTMKWWPFFQLPLEDKRNVLPIEKIYDKNSRIVYLKKALDEEIKKKDGLTR